MKKMIIFAYLVCVMFFVGCSTFGSGSGYSMPGNTKLESAGKTAIMNATEIVEVVVIADLEAFKIAVKACDSHERMIELLFNALYMYEIMGKVVADRMMVEIVDPLLIMSSGGLGASTASHMDRFLKHKEYVRSYFNAQPPAYDFEYTGNFSITLMPNKTQDMSKGTKKYFVRTAGKDFDSPIQIKEYEGKVFKVLELSSLATGVRDMPK
ncbi:MAG: hypothetical protein K8S87_03985 [Planctomycetes bacterium]|nr:hypothetical protein [Planctomycetota bacterium]